MKSTYTNENQTTGHPPVSIKSASPPCMWILCLAIAALAGFASNLHAAISVGDSGSGINTFDATPAATEWATLSWTGGLTDVTDAATMDTAVYALIASNISTAIPGVTTTNPPSANVLARRNAALNLLQMRPNGTKGCLLMATLQNTNSSGNDVTKLQISYDFGHFENAVEELEGVRVYYSMTGLEGSWTAIPDLCTATAGSLSTVVTLSSKWAFGAKMYVLWADDDASGTDDANTIDNASFTINEAVPSANMLTFDFGTPYGAATINGTNITIQIADPNRMLAPTYTLSAGATCDVANGYLQDFSSPVPFTVESLDHNVTKIYTVTVLGHPMITTRGDGRTVATFNLAGNHTWTVPSGVTTMEVLVVGGGGGAWNDGYQSGSGAGGMYQSSSYAVTPGSLVSVTVGAGATQGTGGFSQFGTQLIAYGGTKGNGYTDGGDQGGYSPDGGTTIVPGNLGMHYTPFDGNWSSGGGAGHAGYKGDAQLGGAGAVCYITGSTVYYAGGGGGPSSYASSGGTGYNVGFGGTGPTVSGLRAFSGGANTGGGGGGGWGGGGGAGGSGVVIVAYLPGVTTYTVSFNSNGGSSVASQEVPTGGKATQPSPAPTRSDYTFAQWCSDSGLTTAFDFANTTITGPTTIYAKWLINHTVSFESNGGSAVSGQIVPDGNTATQPTAPTKTGYTFGGWYSDSDLTPPAFSFSTPITADTPLYAKWTINSYTLAYNAGLGGAIEGTTPQTVDYLGSGTAVKAVANPDWQFLKWSDNSTDNPRTDTGVTSNITVTAIFQPPFPAITTRGDGYTLATFYEGSGTWTVPAGVTSVEVLVVGGGGGNGAWTSGAGAGGMYYTANYPVTAGSGIQVAVAAGGVAPQSPNNQTATGGTTKFGQLWAYGGTGGPGYRNGGDQGGYSTDGGITVVPGVIAYHSPEGGGFFCSGSGAVGQGVGPDSAAGGIGLQCAITGTNTYYAGGGGGNANGPGGLGGGGHGSYVFGGPADAGAPNTGGGGGGSWGGTGGAGGSGIVIVAYLATSSTPYQTWAATFPGFTDTDLASDPDGDGQNNLMEFSFNGDPTDGARNGRIYSFTGVSVDYPDKVLVLTAAVRTGTPGFVGSPATAVHPTDGIKYTVEGGTNLIDWTGLIFCPTEPITSGLPLDPETGLPVVAGDGYEFRSFILDSSNGLPGKGFLRAKVEPSP